MNADVAKLLRAILAASRKDDDSSSVEWKGWGSTTGGVITASWFADDFPKGDEWADRLTRAGFVREPTALHYRSWRRVATEEDVRARGGAR